MATNKKLRTPIIKPRTQGGTFYTFSSAGEDVGLNIAEQKNKISLSHYVLLDIPNITQISGSSSIYPTGSNTGDYILAENMQNYVLNMEAVLRNQSTYNFASNLTVSERTFWKWLSKQTTFTKDDHDDSYYVNEDSSVVKAFGLINASSHRSDSCGLYNETFVQIPSSYGKMKVLFKPTYDENMAKKSSLYESTNEGKLENIQSSEIDVNGNIKVTGISATGQFDEDTGYKVSADTDVLKVDFDLDDLRAYYEDDSITIDDIGMGKVSYGPTLSDSFDFNAVLLYYSVYDSAGTKILATNAYGLLLLDNASASTPYKIPTLNKMRSSSTASGTSYSFRVNVKTASAYTGDVIISDNATATYSMSEDFNDVIKNLNDSIEVLKSNAATLLNISNDNSTIKALAAQALDKTDELETTINALKAEGKFESVTADDIIAGECATKGADSDASETISQSVIDDLLLGVVPAINTDGKLTIKINEDAVTDETAKLMLESLLTTVDGEQYIDTMSMLALLLARE